MKIINNDEMCIVTILLLVILQKEASFPFPRDVVPRELGWGREGR
jgi:hypothetical protein